MKSSLVKKMNENLVSIPYSNFSELVIQKNSDRSLDGVSEVIEWCEIFDSKPVNISTCMYNTDPYKSALEYDIVIQELKKFDNIPDDYFTDVTKKDYLVNDTNMALLSSADMYQWKNFQILIKFTDEYQTIRKESHHKLQKDLENFTGEIGWEATHMDMDEHIIFREQCMFSFSNGKIVDVKEIYHYNGREKRGKEVSPMKCDLWMREYYKMDYYGYRFITNFNHWKLVDVWFSAARKEYEEKLLKTNH